MRTRFASSRSKRALAALAVGIFLLTLLGIASLRPAGSIAADETEHVQESEPLPLIEPGKTIDQRFTARADDLDEVTIRFGTYGGATDCAVRATLTQEQAIVAERVIECADIGDTVLFRLLSLPPQHESKDSEYTLHLAFEGDGQQRITVWGGAPAGNVPAAEQSGRQLDQAIELHTGYDGGDTVLGNLGTVLRRMSQYGPFWDSPFFVVVIAVAAIASLVAAAAFAPKRAVILILLFAALKGIFWSALIPPLEGVDEPAHIVYTQFMAEQYRIPRRGSPAFDLPNPLSAQLETMIGDTHQVIAGPGDRPDFGPGSTGATEHDLDHLSPRANGNAAAAGYSPAYYLPAAVFYRGTPGSLYDRIAGMRLWSVALGVLTVWLAICLGRRLFPSSEHAPLLLGLAVAAHPMLTQQFAIVNNDALVITLGAASTVLAVDLVKPNASGRRLLLAGLAAGGAVVAKPFGVVFIALVVLTWIVGRLRQTEPRTWMHDATRIGGGLLATYGVWFVISKVGNFAPPKLQGTDPSPGPKGLRDFLHVLRIDDFKALQNNWVDQFWGNFSWVDTPMPAWVHSVLTTVELVLVGAVLVWLVVLARDWLALRRANGWLARRPDRVETVFDTLVCVTAIAGTLALLYLVAFMQFRLTGRNDLIQGRYALMIAPALLALPALLLRRFTPRLSPAVPLMVIAGAMVAMNVLGVGLLVDRFYL